MKLGVLGTGMVGNAIASRLTSLGHDVMMGAREAANAKAATWVTGAGAHASQGTFAAAAAFGEVLFNCTAGAASLAALEAAGAKNLAGKVLIDVSNPLDFSKGMPPTLTVCNTDSLGERIQRAFPDTQVVKTLNTLNCDLMVNPALLAGGDHDVFVSGDDPAAKARVVEILKGWFGWKRVIDLGGIATARGVEMAVIFWVSLMGAQKTPMFNYKIVR